MQLITGFFSVQIPPRLLLASLVAFCVVPAAFADEDDTFNIYLSLGAQHDNNLFRRPSAKEGDTIQSSSLTLGLNKAISLQRFSLDATLIDYRYQKNDYLDYKATNYNAAYNWAITHRLTGVLSATQVESQNSFVDYSAVSPQSRRNIGRTNVNRLAAEWQVMGGWRLVGGFTNNEQSNSETFRQQTSYVLNSWELGGKYYWPAGNYLQVVRRQGDGEYKGRERVGFDQVPAPFNPQYDTQFRQIETEARLFVPLTGKSSLTGMLARQERQHQYFEQRDYSATVGRVDYTWQPTGKLALGVALRREASVYQDYSSSYFLTDGFNLAPTWQVTAKTLMRFSYDWQRRSFEGALIPSPERKDTLQSIRFGIDWLPVRWATITASYQRDSRDSTRAFSDFNADIFSVNARFNY